MRASSLILLLSGITFMLPVLDLFRESASEVLDEVFLSFAHPDICPTPPPTHYYYFRYA